MLVDYTLLLFFEKKIGVNRFWLSQIGLLVSANEACTLVKIFKLGAIEKEILLKLKEKQLLVYTWGFLFYQHSLILSFPLSLFSPSPASGSFWHWRTFFNCKTSFFFFIPYFCLALSLLLPCSLIFVSNAIVRKLFCALSYLFLFFPSVPEVKPVLLWQVFSLVVLCSIFTVQLVDTAFFLFLRASYQNRLSLPLKRQTATSQQTDTYALLIPIPTTYFFFQFQHKSLHNLTCVVLAIFRWFHCIFLLTSEPVLKDTPVWQSGCKILPKVQIPALSFQQNRSQWIYARWNKIYCSIDPTVKEMILRRWCPLLTTMLLRWSGGQCWLVGKSRWRPLFRL